MSVKKVFLKIPKNSQENTCSRISFLIKLQTEAGNFIKKETLAQVLSCEFCEVSKKTFSYRTPPVAASEIPNASNNLLKTNKFYCTVSLFQVRMFSQNKVAKTIFHIFSLKLEILVLKT